MRVKKIFMIIFIFSMVVLCCSCDGDVTRDIRHAGYSLGNDTFTCSDLVPEDDEDISYKKIKYYNNNYAITENGEIYDISIGVKYSNKENCKKADTSILVDAVLGDVARGKDGHFYYLTAQNNAARFSAVPSTDNLYSLYSLLLGDKSNIKIQGYDNNGSYLILKSDGNIYDYIVSRKENNKEYVVVSSILSYTKSDYGGTIVDFSYAGNNSLGTFIRTENTVYRLRVENADQCNKYADVACTYEMVEDDAFAKHKDKILAFNGSTLITTYGKMFNVES